MSGARTLRFRPSIFVSRVGKRHMRAMCQSEGGTLSFVLRGNGIPGQHFGLDHTDLDSRVTEHTSWAGREQV